MLLTLSVRDVVLIRSLDLTFESGLGVLTGETGAGKSILLDSLGLALGQRAEAGLLRTGADQAVISASFDIPADHAAHRLLAEKGLASDGELILRRVLTRDGRSRAFVNDQPVSVGLLKEIGDTLVEVQAQFAERGLLDPATHRAALDTHAGLEAAGRAVRDAFRRWRQAALRREESEAELEKARTEEEFLRAELAQLEKLAPRPGEDRELAAERALLQNREQLADTLERGRGLLGADDGILDRLKIAGALLEKATPKAGGRLDEALAAVERATLEAEEALSQMDHVGADFEAPARDLEEIEERLFALKDQARRHKVAADELPDVLARLRESLEMLEDSDANIAALREAEAAGRADFLTEAEELRARRNKSARSLERRVVAELADLKLEKARFRVRFDALEETAWSEHGIDRIRFEIATNPDTPFGDLARIASGGELSRIMLALKVVLAGAGSAPTLVFDEVDSGVGGATAAAVGSRLARLAETLQVLVITHSPQVAAQGHYHGRVSKGEDGDGSLTTVETLSLAQRREEIARMISGANITDAARQAADQLLQPHDRPAVS